MVKANRLYKRIEPFAALFWALGNVLAHILKQLTQPAIPQPSYWHGLYGRGQLGSIWHGRRVAPSHFPSRCTYSLGSPFKNHSFCRGWENAQLFIDTVPLTYRPKSWPRIDPWTTCSSTCWRWPATSSSWPTRSKSTRMMTSRWLCLIAATAAMWALKNSQIFSGKTYFLLDLVYNTYYSIVKLYIRDGTI